MSQSCRQVDAASLSGSTVKSMREYQPLVEKALASALLMGTAAVAGPAATAAVIGGALASTVLPPRIDSLPNVRNVQLYGEAVSSEDRRLYRVWRATVQRADGTAVERTTKPVLHEPAPEGETDEQRRQRENREHKRVVRALRDLDTEAMATDRAKDRERKRAKAVMRASQMPALPLANGDPVWQLPPGQLPHFDGEHVWHMPAAGKAAQQATIEQLFRDGSARIIINDSSARVVSSAEQLQSIHLQQQPPSYVGQCVTVEGPLPNYRRCLTAATVTAVHDDRTVDLQLEGTCENASRVVTRVHVQGSNGEPHIGLYEDGDHKSATVMEILQQAAQWLVQEAKPKARNAIRDSEDEGKMSGSAMESSDGEMEPSDVESDIDMGEASDGEMEASDSQMEESDSESEVRGCFPNNPWIVNPWIELCPWILEDCGIKRMLRDDGEIDDYGIEVCEPWRLAKAQQDAHLSTLGDESFRYYASGVDIRSSEGFQLYRAPRCRRCNRCDDPSLCPVLQPGHFRANDHPPRSDGVRHPFIAVAEAEAAGLDMSEARAILGKLLNQLPRGKDKLWWPSLDGIDIDDPDWWDVFIYRATHRVVQDESMVAQIRALSSENINAILGKRIQPDTSDEPPPPKFLRVAERMRRWKEQQKAKRLRQVRLTDAWRAQRVREQEESDYAKYIAHMASL